LGITPEVVGHEVYNYRWAQDYAPLPTAAE
jgi:hypothetical protein